MADQLQGHTVVQITVVLDSIGTRHNVASMVKDLKVALEELVNPLGILDIRATATAIEVGSSGISVNAPIGDDDIELEG